MVFAPEALAKRSCDDDASFDRLDDAVTELEALLDERERGMTPVLVGTEGLVEDLTYLSECDGALGRRALFYLARLHGLRSDDLEERRAVIRLRARPLSPEEEKELEKHYPSESAPPAGDQPPERAPTTYDSDLSDFDDEPKDDPGPTAEEKERARRERSRKRQERMRRNPLLQNGAGFDISLGGRRIDRAARPLGLGPAPDFEYDAFFDFGLGGVFQLGLLRLAPRMNVLYAGTSDEDDDDSNDERQVGVGLEAFVGAGFQTAKATPYVGGRFGASSLGSFVAGWEAGLNFVFGPATIGFYAGGYFDPSMQGGGGGVKLGFFDRKEPKDVAD